jgi:UDP-glucose-4-epimerase GalE
MRVLVAGGAGYIGSHCCKELAREGHEAVVFDNLSKGHRELVRWGDFHPGDIGDPAALDDCLGSRRFDAVMHFAAFIEVGESVGDPLKYYANNVAKSLCLIAAAVRHRVPAFIFSSSAAVYGNPIAVPIDEDHPTAPVSPYGWTKRMVEAMLADVERAHGMKWAALRYFNAAGADPDGETGEWHTPESHLIPRVLDAARDGGRPIRVFGRDYPTADGTCIRDYIHVSDLARAHVLALARLAAGGAPGIFNLGQGRGCSVMEIIAHAERITGRKIPVEVSARRPGDAPVLIASNRRARRELGWEPRQSGLEEIIATAWSWHRQLGRKLNAAAAEKPPLDDAG